MSSQEDITKLLGNWRGGDESARSQLFELMYDKLRELALGVLSNDRQRFAIQPTELVNECSLRLLNISELDWKDRSHFLAMVVTTMRRVLIDQARKKQTNKRDGVEVTLQTGHLDRVSKTESIDLFALDEPLSQLETVAAEKARIVELKFFGGLSNKEIAEVMGVSESTVKRSWRSARAWLYVALGDSSNPAG